MKGIRTCIVCERKRKQQEMLRLAVNRAGRVVVDADGRMGGRGAYVCYVPCAKELAKVRQLRWNRLFRHNDISFVPEGMSFGEQKIR